MLIRCAVLVLYLIVARTEVSAGLSKDFVNDLDARYSLWPSIHHGVRLMRIHKREVEAQPTPSTVKPVKPDAQAGQAELQPAQSGAQGASEGQSSVPIRPQSAAEVPTVTTPHSEDKHLVLPLVTSPAPPKKQNEEKSEILDNKTVHKSPNDTISNDNSTTTVEDKTKAHNVTATEQVKINLSDPGVVKRASIVFGGFALLATAYYFIIYRRKGNTNDAKNAHSSIDQNQFRYGVLESEDKRSNMELSRVPLTMESDEDDDEDLEIFDLGQKKRSLSYINLEQHDEDIVLNDTRSVDMENILVDIEDKNSDMINWSGNGSKSIL